MALSEEQRIRILENMSRSWLEAYLETGELPLVDGQPLSVESVRQVLDDLLERHKVTLANASVDFLFGLARQALRRTMDPDRLKEIVSTATGEEILAMVEQDAEYVRSLADRAGQRRAFLDDLVGTAQEIVRSALIVGVSALASALK